MREHDDDWGSLFDPRTVCVIGASSNPSRIGGRLVRYSVEAGFTGTIIPVGRRSGEIAGIPIRSSITEVTEAPDLTLIAVPRDDTLEAVNGAVAAGTRNIAVVAAGFAEQDAEGAALQAELRRITDKAGVRLLGPNCNGIMNARTNAYFAFTPVLDSARPWPGDVAVVTQSAAVGTYFLNYARTIGLGISHWVHTGNEADVTMLEVARQLIVEERTRAIALSYELLRDPAAVRGLVTLAAQTGTALAVLPGGVSTTGRRAALAHTAALVQDDGGLLADLLTDAGAYVGHSIEAVVNYLQVATNHRVSADRPRLALVTTSGGIGVLMSDAADRADVELPELSEPLQQRLHDIAPFCHPRNPVDTTAQTINVPDAFQRILHECRASGEVDLVSVFIAHGLGGTEDITFRQVLAEAREEADSGLAAVGLLSVDACRALQQLGASVFREPTLLAEALGAVAAGRARQARFVARISTETPATKASEHAATDEVAAKAMLAAHGVQIPRFALVEEADAAADAADEIGYPVVMKIVSAAIPHKAAVGALALDIHTAEAARLAFTRLAETRARLNTSTPASIIVEKQVKGAEAFVGSVAHADHGGIVAIGAGGGAIETDRRISWSWQPVDADAVAGSLRRYLGSGVTDGQVEAIARLADVTNVSLHQIGARFFECNPVILTADSGAVVADALIESAADTTTPGELFMRTARS